MPMSSLILWDVERLKRLSRWRICDDPGRETLRAYARTILALHELEEAAEKLPMNSMTCSTPTAPTKLQFADSPQTFASAPVVLKSALRTRRSAPALPPSDAGVSQPKPPPATGRRIRWKPPIALCSGGALPTLITELLESWVGTARFGISSYRLLLTWLPLIF